MESLPDLAAFLGWCALINIVLLIASTLGVILAGDRIARIHGALFDLDAAQLRPAYFQYIAQFKILFLVLNLVPYIAIRIMLS